MSISLTDVMQELEWELLQPEIRSDTAKVSSLLGDDFVEFGESGRRYTKQDVLENLRKPSGAKYTMLDFATQQIAPRVVLATYRTLKVDPGTGKKTTSLRSSLWRSRDGKWQLIFHQGTPERESPDSTPP